jgi:hypothetical protein
MVLQSGVSSSLIKSAGMATVRKPGVGTNPASQTTLLLRPAESVGGANHV